MSFSIGNFIVLGMFFLSGFYFGKLTKNLNALKIILAIVLGAFFYDLLNGAHVVIIWAFLLGVLANHGPLFYRVYYWGYDLKDVIFAFKHRSAFDDIRQREEELEERVRQFQEEQTEFEERKSQHSKQSKSDTSRNQTHKTKAKSNQQKRRSSKYPENQHRTSPIQNKLRAKYLRTLGLDSTKNYNPDEIRKAYRTTAKKTHPDTGGSQTAFIEVVEAYEWLRNIRQPIL